jgi:SAM-dependent methyltransferase
MLFRNRLHWLLQNGLKRCDAILDYGCGSGLFVRYLKENGYQAIGFDPFVERFNDPGILQRKFDVVVLQDVIEHVPDPAALLATCVQALSDDGFIGIGTPNADEIALVAKPHWPMELHQPYHRHMFSEAGLAGLCERAGLAKGKIYRRSYTDTLVPGINMAFGKMYIDDNGGYIDALYKLPRLKLPTPKYWFVAFFGYFLRSGGTMFCVFRKRAGQAIQSGAQNADQSA